MTRLIRGLRLAPLALCVWLGACATQHTEVFDSGDAMTFVSAQDPRIAATGRTQALDNGALRFGYPGVSVTTEFTGTQLALRAHSTGEESYLDVRIDGGDSQLIRLGPESERFELIRRHERQTHEVNILHRSETWHGLVTLNGLEIDAGAQLRRPEMPERRLLVIGDSVTCGEAIDRTPNGDKNSRWWNPRESYGLLIAQRLNAQAHLVCYGGRGLVRSWNGNTDEGNAPEFFEQTLAGAEPPVLWNHQRYTPDLVLISLGTNDFSLGIGPLPEREHYISEYVTFVERILSLYPDAQIALTEGSIVNDRDDPKRPQKTVLRAYIKETLDRLDNPRTHFVPSHHHPGDDLDAHPTKAQHAAMAEELSEPLRRIMNW